MEYRPLGKTGLTVSVAGLGCGGNSRLGLGRGASFDDCVAVVRTAVDLGVNFLDTAEAYGTEEIVGAAVRSHDRTKLVISTKAIFNTGDTGETVTRKVEAALRRFAAGGMDGVEAFYITHTREQTELVVERCSALGMLTTGSSDFHGPGNRLFSRFLAFETYGLEPNLGPIASAR